MSNTFVSPEGNPEVWDVKPEGYFDSWEDYLATLPQPPAPSEEELLKRQIEEVDRNTSAKILAGFNYTIKGQNLHFSYKLDDQQNFADTANVATLAAMGVPGMPATIVWNGWELFRDTNNAIAMRILHRLELTMPEFLDLYTNGALTHKVTQMEIGSQKKQGLLDQLIALQDG